MGLRRRGPLARTRSYPPTTIACALLAAPALMLATAACTGPFDASSAESPAPVPTPPEMVNQEEVAFALWHAYPEDLKAAGISGRVLVWCTIDPQGRVIEASLARRSGYPEMDRAALEVARNIRFKPATNEGVPTRVRVRFPLTFRAR